MRMLGVIALVTACGGGDPVERPLTFGGDRPVDLKVPANFDDGRTYPLVLVLHGFGFSGFGQAAYFHVNTLPSDGEAFVLAPDGTTDRDGNQFWNADPGCCDFYGSGVDDVGYLTSLIEDVTAAWPISRVDVLGHSNGAFMGYRMACDRAELIDSAALLAGNTTLPASSCAPSRSVRMLVMHGTLDEMVPYDGAGNGTDLASAGAVGSLNRWAAYDGCGSTTTAGSAMDLDTQVDGAETSVQVADGCPTGREVELWTLTGSSHTPSFGPAFVPALTSWFSGE